MHYFKRQWEESRGDEHADWGASTWYFETEHDMWPIRQIEVYASGTVLQYDRDHIEDVFGGLSEAPLDATEFAPFVITQAEFERIWSCQKPMNR
jgi:hypothetical protein